MKCTIFILGKNIIINKWYNSTLAPLVVSLEGRGDLWGDFQRLCLTTAGHGRSNHPVTEAGLSVHPQQGSRPAPHEILTEGSETHRNRCSFSQLRGEEASRSLCRIPELDASWGFPVQALFRPHRPREPAGYRSCNLKLVMRMKREPGKSVFIIILSHLRLYHPPIVFLFFVGFYSQFASKDKERQPFKLLAERCWMLKGFAFS